MNRKQQGMWSATPRIKRTLFPDTFNQNGKNRLNQFLEQVNYICFEIHNYWLVFLGTPLWSYDMNRKQQGVWGSASRIMRTPFSDTFNQNGKNRLKQFLEQVNYIFKVHKL
ncbi:hypothetical protein FACS1894132_08850 [Clostridia bacterium]|nr:hypothetical protein FACS1894132_08850 [Clostridia bacterium]